MSRRTQNTENNTMVYLVENNEAKMSHEEEDFAMNINTSIVMFMTYPIFFRGGDTTMALEHGMSLLDIALTLDDENEQSAIGNIVIATAYMLEIDELVRAAFKFMSDESDIVDEFYAEITLPRDDINGYFDSTEHHLETLGIDDNEKEKAIIEIMNMVQNTIQSGE